MVSEADKDNYVESDVEAAEATDSALAALRFGVPPGDVESAFGAEPSALASLAARIAAAAPPGPAAPNDGYVSSLELKLVQSFDRRPVPARWRLPASRLSRAAELAIAGALAAVIALGAFLMGASSIWNGSPTAVPTANAETTTATAAADAVVTATVAGPSAVATAATDSTAARSGSGPDPVAPRTLGDPAGPESGSRQNASHRASHSPPATVQPAADLAAPTAPVALPGISRQAVRLPQHLRWLTAESPSRRARQT